MRNAGWQRATQERVKRIWQQEGLKVPGKQAPKGRLWLNDGSCLRLRAQHPNHVWSYDFVFVRDVYGRKIRMLTMIDEFTRICLVIHCALRIGSKEVIEQLADAMIIRSWTGIDGGMPDALPVLGHSRTTPGLIHAFGFSGHGFKFAPLLGLALAAAAEDTALARALPGWAAGRDAPALGLLAGLESTT
jgi:glycine/D-amino acid oxidase-like deaminating enzyme